MHSPDPLLDEIIRRKMELEGLALQHFSKFELFSWLWWLGLALMIVVPFVWWKVADKSRLMELLVFGLVVAVISTCLDILGSDMALWEYRIHVYPQHSMIVPIDFFVLPCVKMVFYQKFPKWGKFLLACALSAVVLSFGLEPFAIWAGQYILISWRLIYSFPIYICVAAAAKFIAGKFKKVELVYTAGPSSDANENP